MRGKFIVIDGMDGSGKGTQIDLLKKKLEGKNVIFTREPGGVPIAEKIRSLLVDKDTESSPLTDLFLFNAARIAHLEEKVLPALEKGAHVITDRFDSSTWAYQLYGSYATQLVELGRMKEFFNRIRSAFPREWLPNAYILLDLPARVAKERRDKDAAQEKSRFDLKPLEYYEHVAEGYRAFAHDFIRGGPCFNKYNIQTLDADCSREALHHHLLANVEYILSD